MPKRNQLQDIEKGKGWLVGPSGHFSIYSEGEPSCMVACPAGVDVKAYVNLIADRRYEDAVQIVRLANPFPGICGRVCTHPCEAECGRKDIDSSVSIRTLKRFAADYELSRKKPMAPVEKTHKQKVAIVGGGPAGLTAASDMALEGFDVTVFDSGKEAGGLLAWGIPDFRLPKNIVRSEIRDIQALGVRIVTGKKVEQPAKLLKDYLAVLLATGCQKPVLPGIDGENSEGVIDCLDFLRSVADGNIRDLKGKVIVIGGGNAALDSARTAMRLGAKVTIAYRRTEEQMPADREEIEHAKQEGVQFSFLAIPVEVIADKKQVKSIKFQAAKLGEPDASGRRSPVPIPNDYFTLEADCVIMAIGSKPDVAGITEKNMGLTKSGTVKVDDNGMTSLEGVFAAGDITSGPSTIIDAIGSGHVAARGIINYLLGDKAVAGAKQSRPMLVVETPAPTDSQRCESCFIPMEKRQSTFDEVEIGIEERAAITEASRCRRCGSCGECATCLAVCDYRNAVVTVPKSGETILAKLPFVVAKDIMNHPDKEWRLESDKDKTTLKIEPLLAYVDDTLCIACGKCEDSCPYRAIRTIFDVRGNAFARVEETSCRGCGACASVCPTGAIAMGFMGDDAILNRIHEAVKSSKPHDHVVVFSCIWNDFENGIAAKPWEIKLQCTRRASPALILEALASGAKAVAIKGCAEDECHYLPGPWMGQDIVESCKGILEAIDILPERVGYADGEVGLNIFISELPKIKPFKPNLAKILHAKSGIARCLNNVQVLMAQPDETRDIRAKDKLLMAYGCLATSEPTFRAYGIQEHGVQSSILLLLEKTGINYEIAHGVHVSGTSLKEWGMEDLYRNYSKSITSKVKKSKAKSMAVATPKSYLALSEIDFGCEVVTLPAALKEKLSGAFNEADERIAYHPACLGGGKFDDDCLELLGIVPNLKVVMLEGACGETGWRNVSSDSRKQALALLNKAEKIGVKILVTGSSRCAVNLNSMLGGWNTSSVRVVDIYTYLASRLGGDE
jgi:formate dehydrogenase beta subunit